jgi:hypothetical protein
MTNPDEDQIERDAKVMYDFIAREGVDWQYQDDKGEMRWPTYEQSMTLLKRAIRKVHQENYPARVRVKAGKETK